MGTCKSLVSEMFTHLNLGDWVWAVYSIRFVLPLILMSLHPIIINSCQHIVPFNISDAAKQICSINTNSYVWILPFS